MILTGVQVEQKMSYRIWRTNRYFTYSICRFWCEFQKVAFLMYFTYSIRRFYGLQIQVAGRPAGRFNMTF